MKYTITFKTAQQWLSNINDLIDIYQYDDSLTMDIEWALYQNFKYLNQVQNSFNKQKQELIVKYGTLQEDDSYVVDTDCDITMSRYNQSLNELMDTKIKTPLEKIDHKTLIGKKGVTLDTMTLFDFMII